MGQQLRKQRWRRRLQLQQASGAAALAGIGSSVSSKGRSQSCRACIVSNTYQQGRRWQHKHQSSSEQLHTRTRPTWHSNVMLPGASLQQWCNACLHMPRNPCYILWPALHIQPGRAIAVM